LPVKLFLCPEKWARPRILDSAFSGLTADSISTESLIMFNPFNPSGNLTQLQPLAQLCSLSTQSVGVLLKVPSTSSDNSHRHHHVAAFFNGPTACFVCGTNSTFIHACNLHLFQF
jgi:hypothetical protein